MSSVVIVSVCVLLICVDFSTSEFRDVVLDQGTVRGYVDDGVYSFYGVPYASAPTGADRFKAPLPAPTWSDIFNATIRNIICPQRDTFSDTFLVLDRRIDCLRANIFVPHTQDSNLPVMVYIHGGGLQEGYGLILNPTDLAKRGIIAVNFNYRLGVHGFLCLGTEFASGNAGFKDQVAALKWVKRNIASFGGDPDDVTLAGSSAGGMSVELQILSEMSDGLFNKAILESGPGLYHGFIQTQTMALEVAKSFTSHFGETIQEISAMENFYASLSDSLLSTGSDYSFLGCLESHNVTGVESFLKKIPGEIIRSGNYEKRRLLSGFTPMEGLEFMGDYKSRKPAMESNFSAFLPSDIYYHSEEHKSEVTKKVKDFYFPTGEVTHQGYIDFFSDSVFGYPLMLSTRIHTKNAAVVYLFLYSFNGTVNLPSVHNSPVWGPGHVAASLYIQNYDYTPLYANMTTNDLLVQERLREMWINFIKFGDPIPTRTTVLDVDWSPVTAEADYYLNIDLQMTFGQDPLAERIALWDAVYNNTNSSNSISRNSVISILAFSLFCSTMILK